MEIRSHQILFLINSIMSEKLTHLRALMLKSASIQAKQKCTNCCQIMTPLVCIIFTYLIKVIAGDQLPIGQISTVVVPVLANYPAYLFEGKNYSGGLVRAANPICWYLLHYDNPQDRSFLGSNDGLGNKSGLLSNVLQKQSVSHAYDPSRLNQTKLFSMPYFNITSNHTNPQLYSILKIVDRTPYNSSKISKRIVQTIPEGAFEVHAVNSTFLNVTIQNNDLRELFYRQNNGRSMITAYTPDGEQNNVLFSTSEGYFAAMDLMSNAFISQKAGVRSVSGYLDMPPNPYQGSFAEIIINLSSSTLFSLSLSLLLPVFMYAVVLQKEEKLIEMMKMNGCSISVYWVSVFIFNFILSLITFAVFMLAGLILLRNDFFLETGFGIFIVVLLGWAIGQLGVAIFFQTFVGTARTANIAGYLLSIWTSIISTTLNLGVYPYPKSMNLALLTYPPLGFGRVIYMMLSECSNAVCYPGLSALPSQLIYAIVCMYVVGLLLFVVGIYFYQILPKEIGVARPWYYPVQGLLPSNDGNPERSEVEILGSEELDVESLKEQDMAIQAEPSAEYSLHCKGLRKIYPSVGNKPQQLAVKSFSLLIKNGQIFGLLGPNGAGKTTLLSMLTGIYKSNKGDAWISGYNIKTDLPTIHTLIGVCPQFDLLWPELSIEDHLLFYARLKGVERSEEHEKVTIALTEVNLEDKRDKLACELSGGMKRRLSIAISMVGLPKIIFLDEPTTGLDPDNRRQIWEIISKCKLNRSILLTTHSMQEADVLCSRIGIISSGVLRTVGNQITLKNMYVGGYYLEVGLIPDSNQNHIQSLLAFLNEIFEQKNLRRTFKSNFIFEVVLGQHHMSQVFEAIENNKNRLGIETWSISQPRLEEVFMKVVTKYGYLADDD